ncbi:stage III sporulation protein AF [Actinomycetes bacterium NPDC127524]
MSFLTGWVTNIILFVLLATVIDMLLPNSSMQKYAKMVIGLLLIAVILAPILNLFHTDLNTLISKATESFTHGDEKKLKNLTEMKKKEIQAEQNAYILQQTAVQLKAKAKEELMKKYKMEIAYIDIKVKNEEQPKIPEDLQKITLSLSKASASSKSKSIEAVAKVEINTEKNPPAKTADLEKIKKFLSSQWSVDKKVIEITGERGDL